MSKAKVRSEQATVSKAVQHDHPYLGPCPLISSSIVFVAARTMQRSALSARVALNQSHRLLNIQTRWNSNDAPTSGNVAAAAVPPRPRRSIPLATNLGGITIGSTLTTYDVKNCLLYKQETLRVCLSRSASRNGVHSQPESPEALHLHQHKLPQRSRHLKPRPSMFHLKKTSACPL
jgi:hypothetical protein